MARPVGLPRPAFPCPCLTKKLTVIGIIGQTHGIKSANTPPSAEAMRNGINPCSAFWAISLRALGADDEAVAVAARPTSDPPDDAPDADGGADPGGASAEAGALDDDSA